MKNSVRSPKRIMKPSNTGYSFLLKEFEEINSYMRTLYTIGITWYTFFITANTFSVGLFLSEIFKGGALPSELFLIATGLFLFVNLLALAACHFAIYFSRMQEKRIVSILKAINTPGNKTLNVRSPLPLALSIRIIRLMQLSLFGTALFWIGFMLYFF